MRGRMLGLVFAVVLGVASALRPLQAGTRAVPLAPPDTAVEFTTFAMGFYPLVGHYHAFTGELRVDPAQPQACTVTLDVEVGSLVMADPERVRLALGPKLLDQGAYPRLLYRGTCDHGHVTGVLTMHGVSRTLDLVARRRGNVVTASGRLRRQDFGITGLPGLIGGTIAISFVTRLPDDLTGLVDP